MIRPLYGPWGVRLLISEVGPVQRQLGVHVADQLNLIDGRSVPEDLPMQEGDSYSVEEAKSRQVSLLQGGASGRWGARDACETES
jgi:hypothetical protein